MILKQFKYLLFTEIALIISSTIFAILLIINRNYYTGSYKDLYQNWKMTPIKKITVEEATENDYSRNKKSDNIENRQKRLGFFPGLKDFSENFTYDSGDIFIWRNNKFTFEFMDKEFSYNNILKNNLEFDKGKICGVDHLGNNLIFPIDIECPINYIKIINANDDVNSVSEVENPIELNLGDDKKLIYSNKKINGRILINFEIGTKIPCENIDKEKSFCLYFGNYCKTKNICSDEIDAAGYDKNELDKMEIYNLLIQNGYEFEEEYETNSDLINLYVRTWIGIYKKKFEMNNKFEGGIEGFFFCYKYGKIKDILILILSILSVICLFINYYFIKKTKFYSIYISIVLIILFIIKVFIDLIFVLKGKIFKFEISKRILVYKENNIFYQQFKYIDFIIVECALDSMALLIEIIFLILNINDNKLKCYKHCKCCCKKNKQEKKDKLHKILHQNCIRIVKWNKNKIINNIYIEAQFNKKSYLNLLRNAISNGKEIDKIYIDNIIPFDNNRNNVIFLFENEEQNEELIVFDISVDKEEENNKNEKTNINNIIYRNDTENVKLNSSYSNSEYENFKNNKEKNDKNDNIQNIIMNLSEEDKKILEKIKNKYKKIDASKFNNLSDSKEDKINFNVENIFNQIYKIKTQKGIAYMKFLSNLNYLKFKSETQAFNGIKKELQNIKEKIKYLMLLNNEHLCKYIGYSIYKGQVVIIIEYIEGESLIDYYKNNNNNISLSEKLNIIKQVADAVDYLHFNKMIHNDIRCKNIYIIKNSNKENLINEDNNNLNNQNNQNNLNNSKNIDNNNLTQNQQINDLNSNEFDNNKKVEIKENNKEKDNNNSKEENLSNNNNNNNNNKYPIVKLCDFGSITLNNENFIDKISELWAAPELIFDHKNSISSDIYCFGSFMYELINEMPPYFGEETSDILLKIRIMKGQTPNLDKLNCIKELKSIISKCWIYKSQFRPSMESIIEELNDINI